MAVEQQEKGRRVRALFKHRAVFRIAARTCFLQDFGQFLADSPAKSGKCATSEPSTVAMACLRD
jgi:hypothetical protein